MADWNQCHDDKYNEFMAAPVLSLRLPACPIQGLAELILRTPGGHSTSIRYTRKSGRLQVGMNADVSSYCVHMRKELRRNILSSAEAVQQKIFIRDQRHASNMCHKFTAAISSNWGENNSSKGFGLILLTENFGHLRICLDLICLTSGISVVITSSWIHTHPIIILFS